MKNGTSYIKGAIWVLTVAGTNAPHAAVALQAEQAFLFRTCQESLLLVCITASDSEADVHSATHRLVWYHTIHVRVPLNGFVDQTGLLVRDLFLPANAFGAENLD